MYYYKSIIYLFLLLLIFINTFIGEKCKKCPKNGKKGNLFISRIKRSFGCNCFGGKIKKEKDFYAKTFKTLQENKQITVKEVSEQSHGETSSKGKQVFNQIKEEKSNKKILYICDNFYYSHVQLNITLVKLLRGKYNIVDVLVYTEKYGIEIKDIKFINNIKIDESRFNENIASQYRFEDYKKSNDYKYVGIYQEIITNEEFFEELKRKKYDIGIADFNEMFGSFAVFEALEIKNTFNVSPSVFVPQYLPFLGINNEIIYKIPAFDYFAEPGDWDNENGICKINSKRYKENKEKQEININGLKNDMCIFAPECYKKPFYYKISGPPDLYEETFEYTEIIEGINKSPKFDVLFNKIKYHFVNQHQFGIFKDFPEHDKIIYIGGILVKEKELLSRKKQNDENCNVFLSFGTIGIEGIDNIFDKLKEEDLIKQMFDVFSIYNECIFNIRINKEYVPEEYSENKKIIILENFVDQQKILANENTILFISHCGVNSLNESIYAGVPLLCIPFSGDQFYNASFVEQKGIGIYLSKNCTNCNKDDMKITNKNFTKDFENALNKILKKDQNGQYNNGQYHKAADILRKEIHKKMNNDMIKEHFLEMIDENS